MNEPPRLTPSPPKRRYSKPTVSRVELRPEEAVLGFCKFPSQRGPLAIGCIVAGTSCRGQGS